MRCDVCGEPFSEKGLRIHVGMRHTPHRHINVDRLWRALQGIGVIENGTWVSFQREDAEQIAREYEATRVLASADSAAPADFDEADNIVTTKAVPWYEPAVIDNTEKGGTE